MKLSALFDSTDQAELAAREIAARGIPLESRRIVNTADPAERRPRLPTEHFYFPAAAEFYTGMASRVDLVTPGSNFYPMSGHVRLDTSGADSARLELSVADQDADFVRDMLVSLHGSRIQQQS